MSKATKNRHVAREVLEGYAEPEDNECIARVAENAGNNLHMVELCDGNRILATMPSKFRRIVYVRRGDFVIIEHQDISTKVKAEIKHILYPEQLKKIRKTHHWPSEFDTETVVTASNGSSNCINVPGSSSDEDDDADLFINTNRAPPGVQLPESNSDDDDADE